MARTVEIGRAVLSSQASSSQLWLTTSITISSENHSTNLQRLNQAQVLEYLLSGSCWVSRGNGLHLVLELSVQGEPLGIEEKEQLATDIVNAPVWEQLHIRASIPEKGVCAAFQESDEKDIRINIDHCRAEPPPKLQLHRIGRNVPFADVRPPAGIPVINLMSVKLNMAVLMNSTKSNTKKQKVNNEPSRKLTDPPSSTIRTHLDSAATQREHSLKQTRGLSGFRDFGVGELSHNTNTGKDNRTVPRTEEASRILTELLTARGEKRKKPTERPTMKDTGFNSVLQQDIHEFSKYMDSALRISVCKGAVKLPQGVKLLTSTFTGTLSEICPAVWRLQYLQVYTIRFIGLIYIPTNSSRACPNELIFCRQSVDSSGEFGRE